MTQDEALAILESGQSVLLTGAAGTGKTYLLNKFISRAKGRGLNVAVTATTGLASTHLNGSTIHAWSGIGLRESLDSGFFNKLSKQRLDIISKVDILIIDEISMLHDFRLDMIEEVVRRTRGGDRPFGGVQVVLCGDFFQLPPVNRADSRRGGFVTSSSVWQSAFFDVLYLAKQYRQKEDDLYGAILNGIRGGELKRSQLDALMARAEAENDPFISQTRLLTTNADVDSINLKKLDEIEQDEVEFEMTTTGSKSYVDQLKRSCLAPEILRLKIGASVMCIRNSADRKYHNGSLGTIVDFEPGSDYPLVKLNNGKEITIEPETWELIDGDKKRASLTQLPLRLAWAITVHKSQGMTLDQARIDLSKAFVEGMGYVALSRVRGLKSLTLDGINGMALRTSPLARTLDAELRRRSQDTLDNNRYTIDQWKIAEAENKKNQQEMVARVSSKSSEMSWTDRLANIRQQYPNAYKAWSETEDGKLVRLFGSSNNIEKLSKLMGRHPGSIRSRLKKLFGNDIIA